MASNNSQNNGGAAPPFVGEIVFSPPKAGENLPPPNTTFRAVHQIRLSAISHNFTCVESAAARQRCSVIVVVKADGYGHGAIESAIHLADNAGADAFAVATLEEGIALRKAFESTPPARLLGGTVPVSQNGGSKAGSARINMNGLNGGQSFESKSQGSDKSPGTSVHAPVRSTRPPQIRIIVLGPPVGYPRCFDDYYHHGIEVMCSGPEVAKGIMEWITDDKERKRTQVERAANDAKAAALLTRPAARDTVVNSNIAAKQVDGAVAKNGAVLGQLNLNGGSAATSGTSSVVSEKPPLENPQGGIVLPQTPIPPPQVYKEPGMSATLGNVSGQDLAKEVRAFLMNQKAAKEAKDADNANNNINPVGSMPANDSTTVATVSTSKESTLREAPGSSSVSVSSVPVKGQMFGGIEAVAKSSRTREMAAARVQGVFREDSCDEDDSDSSQQKPAPAPAPRVPPVVAPIMPKNVVARKRLRYHILVDSGMGRLGFKTQPVEVSDVGVRRDTVEIINELVEMEVHGAPIEFFGMCTHMADANSTSTYTNDQMNRFKGLLKRVRGVNISIPTCSTDNSAALLTTTLTHFDAKALLSQPHSDTRGYVRTGGAIYGQRPAFKQLRAASTLMASVRHVAILKEGESVGYDRAYIARMNVRIATLTIGFADGYPRDLGNGVGKVAIRGHTFPVAGNVCMDMMMVELGPADDKICPGAQVVVGDTAVLWGPADENDGDGLVRLQDVATTLKTTQSALTCGLDKIRVSRQYI